jgi:hypothetical protein
MATKISRLDRLERELKAQKLLDPSKFVIPGHIRLLYGDGTSGNDENVSWADVLAVLEKVFGEYQSDELTP